MILNLLIVLTIIPVVQAIAFIPPVIYFATISLASFITNMIIVLTFWLAVKGATDRLYGGKSLHEIVSTLLEWLGNIALIIISALIAVLITNPLTIPSIFVTSLITGIINFVLLYICHYRKLRIVERIVKLSMLRSYVFITTAVIIITFASATLALETTIIYTNNQAGSEFITEQEPIKLPAFSNEMSKIADMDYAERGSIVPAKKISTLWFYPEIDTPCIINLNNKTILYQKPKNNCYYRESNLRKRTLCPIAITTEMILQEGNQGTLNGSGSCNEVYDIIITSNGITLQ